MRSTIDSSSIVPGRRSLPAGSGGLGLFPARTDAWRESGDESAQHPLDRAARRWQNRAHADRIPIESAALAWLKSIRGGSATAPTSRRTCRRPSAATTAKWCWFSGSAMRSCPVHNSVVVEITLVKHRNASDQRSGAPGVEDFTAVGFLSQRPTPVWTRQHEADSVSVQLRRQVETRHVHQRKAH